MGAVVLAHDTTATKPPINQPAAPPQSAAKAPAGSVEQVAAKVMPSVVKLQIDMGGQGDTGSGIVLIWGMAAVQRLPGNDRQGLADPPVLQ